MGLKFWGDMGSLPGFGKVIIRALIISGGNEAKEAAALNISDMWSMRLDLNFFYSTTNSTSGPGALLLGNALIAFSISSFVNGELK